MTRPARARLDVGALRHNLARVRACAPQSRVMAVVKANAYGHGLGWAARGLADADAFGVASIDEGRALRALGVTHPICLLEGFFEAAEIPVLSQERLSPAIHEVGQLRALERTPYPLDVWLKIDTGMHRLGFLPEECPEVMARLRAIPGIGAVRALSHFACADNQFDRATEVQMAVFQEVVSPWQVERSLANSAGILAWPGSHLEWVRPGLMLYGISPLLGRSALECDLRPVMTLESAVIAVHQLRKGAAVGYGGAFICPEDMKVGVVAIGYGDGYPRHARGGTPVLVGGVQVPLAGRVSMDMITVDLRGRPDTRVGDRAVLWGEGLPAEVVAQHADTIAYTLVCGLTSRIPREG